MGAGASLQAFFFHFFRTMSHDNIVKLVEALLTERSIVFYSSHLAMLGLGTVLTATSPRASAER